jgi:hypothetical protein
MLKIHLIRKFKGFYIASGLERILMPIANVAVFWGNMTKMARWIRKHKNIEFNDFYSMKFNYKKRLDLFDYVIKKENLENQDIDYLEFGVARGESIRWWSNRIENKKWTFHGFDTFSGLPEAWGPFKAGAMSNDCDIPKINDSRCHFYQGLFQQTFPEFIKSFPNSKRKIIHMDADLYTSTLYVLTSIYPYLKKGDIIFFDEFNVPMHEYKAFDEWCKAFYIEYEVLGAVNNMYQIAFKIL